jgi:hypothetical protein
MAFRNDLPFFDIILSDFDNGRTHKTLFPKDWNLQVGDIVQWESGQTHHGYATVVSVDENCALDTNVWIELKENK